MRQNPGSCSSRWPPSSRCGVIQVTQAEGWGVLLQAACRSAEGGHSRLFVGASGSRHSRLFVGAPGSCHSRLHKGAPGSCHSRGCM
eukprot:scaffold99959_cov20-Tisochrysis_lutea.AAC.2